MHGALIELAREKPYPSIAVKEILDRANVARSTFYTHFRDKDDLLETGIREALPSIHDQPHRGCGVEGIVAFSLPLLKHIDGHRRAAGPQMRREGRLVMHEHMEHVLTTWIAEELALTIAGSRTVQIPIDLVARHVASAFVVVLDWWVDSEPSLTPEHVDVCFRDLVVPALARLLTQDG